MKLICARRGDIDAPQPLRNREKKYILLGSPQMVHESVQKRRIHTIQNVDLSVGAEKSPFF